MVEQLSKRDTRGPGAVTRNFPRYEELVNVLIQVQHTSFHQVQSCHCSQGLADGSCLKEGVHGHRLGFAGFFDAVSAGPFQLVIFDYRKTDSRHPIEVHTRLQGHSLGVVAMEYEERGQRILHPSDSLCQAWSLRFHYGNLPGKRGGNQVAKERKAWHT